MNCMVSMDVSLGVPSVTFIASFCTQSSFSRYVGDMVDCTDSELN